jgi:hypothetical protein
LGKTYASEPHVKISRKIVGSDFAEPSSIGVLRLREHPLFRPEFPVGEFISVLKEIFQV